MDGGLGFGDGAVVEADFGGFALEQDALDAFAAAGEQDALGDGGCVAEDLDGSFDGGVAVVGDVDGDQIRAWDRCRAGIDAFDGEVGQAFVGVDPVVEEPAQILALAGLFDQFFEGVCGAVSLAGS